MNPEEMYGPQWERVCAALDEIHLLSVPMAKTIANARRYCDTKPLMSPWHAAEGAGRTRQSARARMHACDAIEVALIDWKDVQKRWAAAAIADAVLAESVADLLNTEDYIRLVTPWRIGWLDRGEVA